MNRFFRSVGTASLFAALAAMLLLTCTSQAEPPQQNRGVPRNKVARYMQDMSVTIRAISDRGRGGEGSGVFKVTKDGQIWIWTCGHLVDLLRSERKNSEGKTVVEFADAQIIKVFTEDGRKVGNMNLDAEVIRYSHAEHGQDLALLRLRGKHFKPVSSVNFYLDKTIPEAGTDLLHCGSLLGQLGSNSITNGVVSQIGRVFYNVTFDQTSSATFPGSSGGAICLREDGRYIGMLVRGAGETFGLYVPVRRMHDWAKKVGIEFAMDDSVAIPSYEKLMSQPIDDSMAKTKEEGAKKSLTGNERLLQYRLRYFRQPTFEFFNTPCGLYMDYANKQ